jgi:hypothetical protein
MKNIIITLLCLIWSTLASAQDFEVQNTTDEEIVIWVMNGRGYIFTHIQARSFLKLEISSTTVTFVAIYRDRDNPSGRPDLDKQKVYASISTDKNIYLEWNSENLSPQKGEFMENNINTSDIILMKPRQPPYTGEENCPTEWLIETRGKLATDGSKI